MADTEQISGADRRAVIKTLATELKGTRPDTSKAPANVTAKDLEAEKLDRQKNVDRQIDRALAYIGQQGWRSRKERRGSIYRIDLWFHDEGQGKGGELPPLSISKSTVDERTAEIVKANQDLEARVRGLEIALAKAKAKTPKEDQPGLNITEEVIEEA